MSASLQLDGVVQLQKAIADMGETVKASMAPVAQGAAAGLASELKSTYARKTGTLAERVVIEPSRGDPLRVKVRSKATHAHLYEYGTVNRFTNRTGAARGRMPEKNVFIPAAIRWRERMARDAKERLRELRVPGFTGTPEVRET